MKVVTGFFLTLLIIIALVIFINQGFVIDVIEAAGYDTGEVIQVLSILFLIVIWGIVAATGGK